MKPLNDIIAEAQALSTSLQNIIVDLQALAAAPIVTPAQATVIDEKITLSGGTMFAFDGTVWTVSNDGTVSAVSAGAGEASQ